MLMEWRYDIYLWIKCGKLTSCIKSPSINVVNSIMGGLMNHPQNHQLYGCYKPSLDGRYIFSLGEAHIHPLATGLRFFTRMVGAVTKGRF